MPGRSRAREVAMQAIYQAELAGDGDPEQLERFIAGRLKAAGLIRFCRQIVAGVAEDRPRIDAAIESLAEHWSLRRMTAVDRSILRIAAHEILNGDVPGPVAVDEAVELAKRYGSEASPRFVAGILGRLLAERPPAAAGP